MTNKQNTTCLPGVSSTPTFAQKCAKPTFGQKCPKVLDSTDEIRYTKDRASQLENCIAKANSVLPTVTLPEESGCTVTLIFSQTDDFDVEKQILRILEHDLIRQTRTGGMHI